ncbi:MAG: hypothetical protein ACTHNU_02995 [Gaiellales bacterium]
MAAGGILTGMGAAGSVALAVAALAASPGPAGVRAAEAHHSIVGIARIKGGPPVDLPYAEFHPLPHAPLVVTGTTSAGASLERHLTTDGRGRFECDVPPGRYTVIALAYNGPQAMQPRAVVQVTGGSSTVVRLTGFQG